MKPKSRNTVRRIFSFVLALVLLQVLIPLNGLTLAEEEFTSTEEEVELQAEKLASAAEELDPLAEEVDPSAEEVDPSAEELTATDEELEPLTEEVDPTAEEPTATEEELQPLTEELDPLVEELAPLGEEITPLASYNVGNASQLTNAINNSVSGDVIFLTASFNCPNSLVIDGKSITLVLNGFTLTVITTQMSLSAALTVQNSGELMLDDSGGGQLNVTGGRYGLYVNNAKATVTNASGGSTGIGVQAVNGSIVTVRVDASGAIGARAESGSTITIGRDAVSQTIYVSSTAAWAGAGSLIEIFGDAYATSSYEAVEGGRADGVGANVIIHGNAVAEGVAWNTFATHAINGGTIHVYGDAHGSLYGAWANDTGSTITIGGNAYGTSSYRSTGVHAQDGASIIVMGNVGGLGSGYYMGATAYTATVWIGGNIVSNDWATQAVAGGEIVVEGEILLSSSGTYAHVSSDVKTIDQYDEPPDPTMSGYRGYSSGGSVVWVKGTPLTYNGSSADTDTITLREGYGQIFTKTYYTGGGDGIGDPFPSVTSDCGAYMKYDTLYIPVGLAAGSYTAVLTASNGVAPAATMTVTIEVQVNNSSDTVDITGKNAAMIQSEIATALSNSANTTVYVVGTQDNGATAALSLAIPVGKNLVWNASYTGATTAALVTNTSGGVFEIQGGALLNTGRALLSSGNVEVRNGALVQSTNGTAISSDGYVFITGGTVCATTGRAVDVSSGYRCEVWGGFVFAYGTTLDDVITGGSTPLFYNSGFACAWDEPAYPGSYALGSSEDLSFWTASPGLAIWTDEAGIGGISYGIGLTASLGFFPLGVNVSSSFTPVKSIHYDTTPLNAAGWTNTDFVVTALPGYKVSTSDTALASWQDSLTRSAETGSGSITFYVKDLTTGNISSMASEAYKLDKTWPEVEIQIRTNSFTQYFNAVMFQLFFENTVDVSASAIDSLSGLVAPVQWYLDAGPLDYAATNWDTLSWTSSAGTSVPANWKGYAYARASDVAGNVVIVRSDGMVVYTNSAQDTTGISFTKASTTDVVAAVTLNGNTVAGVRNGTVELVEGTDYDVVGNVITFYASYLDSLAAGSYTLYVSYNPLDELFVDTPGNDVPDETTITLTVALATQSLSFVGLASAYTYGDAPVSLSVSGGGGGLGTGAVVYEIVDESTPGVATISSGQLTVLMAGNFKVKATKAADSSYAEGTVTSFVVTVSEATPTVSLAGADVGSGSNVVLTATVSGVGIGATPAGTVDFYDGATLLAAGITLIGGVANYTVVAPANGSHSYSVVYSGQGGYYTTASGTRSIGVGLANQTSPSPGTKTGTMPQTGDKTDLILRGLLVLILVGLFSLGIDRVQRRHYKAAHYKR